MNSTPLLRSVVAVGAIALASLTSSIAHARSFMSSDGYFARANVLYANPSESGMDDGYGILGQLGATYGSGEFALELGQLWFDQSMVFDFGETVYDVDGDLAVTPIQLCGRIGFDAISDGRLRVLAGAFGGAASMNVKVSVSEDGERLGSVSDTEWAGSYGFDVGILAKLSKKAHVSAGVRYQVLGGTTYSVEGIDVDTEDLKLTIFYAGFGMDW